MIWPEQAYVPGQTPRHPEGLFDAVRDTALPSATVEELAQCPAFRHGLMYQRAGFYWEAHEVFEPVWMVLPEPSVERRFVQSLIQIANGYLKVEMKRPKAAMRLSGIARELLPISRDGAIMGVELWAVHELIDSLAELANIEL